MQIVCINIINKGLCRSNYRASNIIKKLDLVSCQITRHAFKKAIQEYVAIPNILNRQFAVTELDQPYCGDVTYIWIGNR